MGRNGILAQDVIAIAEQLVTNNEIPTIEKVRVILGTGSNSTIAKHLTEWKTSRLKADYKNIIANYAAPDPVNQAVARVWQQLQEENQSKLDLLEQQTAAKIHAALDERDAAVNYSQKLLADNQDLKELLINTRQQNEVLTSENKRLNDTAIALNAKLEICEQAHQDFKQYAAENHRSLEEKYSYAIQYYESQQCATQNRYENELNAMKELAEEQRHKYIVEIDHLKTQNQKLQSQLLDKDKTIAELTKRLGQLSANAINKNQEFEELVIKHTLFEKNLLNNYQDIFTHFKNECHDIWEANFINLSKTLKNEFISNNIKKDKKTFKVIEDESAT